MKEQERNLNTPSSIDTELSRVLMLLKDEDRRKVESELDSLIKKASCLSSKDIESIKIGLGSEKCAKIEEILRQIK